MNKEEFLKAKEDHIGLLMQSKSDKINIYIEGKDDHEFYYQFFKESNPNLVRCYSKKNVLKVASIYNRIGSYTSLFFADADFDNNDEIDNVFFTNFYNFESHIFSRENLKNYLENKHSLCRTDIESLIEFLNSDIVLQIFHTEHERIMIKGGISANRLIKEKLNSLNIDSSYIFSYEDIFTQNHLPAINTPLLESIEMYNGKYIGNLIYSIFKSAWFNEKFASDMRRFERKKLTLEFIINSSKPKYVEDAINHLATR